MGIHVDGPQQYLVNWQLPVRSAGKHQQGTIGRPRGIVTPRRSRLTVCNLHRSATLCRYHEYSLGSSRDSSVKGNALAVWRPAGAARDQWRRGELTPLTAIHRAPPERALVVAGVSHPLPIAREVQICRRNARQVRSPLARPGVVPDQLGSFQITREEDPFSIRTRDRIYGLHRPRRQLHGFIAASVEEARLFP